MATPYVPLQGMARNGAKSITPLEFPCAFEPEGVAIPTDCWEFRQVQSFWSRLGQLAGNLR